MSKLFLKFGARVNVKASIVGTEFDGFLPLDFALYCMRKMVVWSREQSLFKLIIFLTGEGMRVPMDTMRLLIEELSDSAISEGIYCYAAEGKTIELAALLILVSQKNAFCMVDNLFIPSNDASSGERITLRQYVVNEIVNLESETGKLVVIDSMELAECKKMKKSMMSVLLLLEIFLRTKDEIADTARCLDEYYSAIPRKLACLFEASGFKLTG